MVVVIKNRGEYNKNTSCHSVHGGILNDVEHGKRAEKKFPIYSVGLGVFFQVQPTVMRCTAAGREAHIIAYIYT